MTIWTALVLKTRLEGDKRQHDIIQVEAKTKEEAISTIANHKWDDTLWQSAKSRCAVLKIFKYLPESFSKEVWEEGNVKSQQPIEKQKVTFLSSKQPKPRDTRIRQRSKSTGIRVRVKK